MGVRDEVGYDGIGNLPVSYKHDGSIVYDATKQGGSAQVGRAVRLTGDRQVGLTIDASPVEGKLVKVEDDGFCGVVVDGYVPLPARTGAVPAAGDKVVGALGGVGNAEAGFIRAANPATLAEVAAAGDTEVINAADPANVVVQL